MAPISTDARPTLGEAIRLVFGQWTALQVAVQERWGDCGSHANADQFSESILSWFYRSRVCRDTSAISIVQIINSMFFLVSLRCDPVVKLIMFSLASEFS